VNQDRYCEVTPFAGHEDRAVFGVFDGHGALGHEVRRLLHLFLSLFGSVGPF
jgi:serine/threonine protein phosphatase PrpC